MTGSGTDAQNWLVAMEEGKWKEEIKSIEKEQCNDGEFWAWREDVLMWVEVVQPGET